MPFGLELPQTYSVEPYKSSACAWFWWWERATGLIWKRDVGGGSERPCGFHCLDRSPPHWKKPPYQKESQHRWLEQRTLPTLLHWTLYLYLNQNGQHLLRTWSWCPLGGHHHPAGYSPQGAEDLTMPPLEDTYLPRAMTSFDLSTLELLKMTISHTPVTGEVHYCLQAQSLTMISLPSTSS